MEDHECIIRMTLGGPALGCWIKVSLNWLDGGRNSCKASGKERGFSKLGKLEEGRRSGTPL